MTLHGCFEGSCFTLILWSHGIGRTFQARTRVSREEAAESRAEGLEDPAPDSCWRCVGASFISEPHGVTVVHLLTDCYTEIQGV